ncbi:pseudouridylate synthase 7 homolog-like protein [Varanus komodoensis]|nr:pseudouridylate synthase 7 homolog-like protein [Varanus komodoensis]XP_044278998.1 pseudouridylate synthase 7 homolog-like protein [Varanus komodoensis]XP_044278999.1 pseudouridylate synthase 7 homolog-like protein [Varanus komodoensis]
MGEDSKTAVAPQSCTYMNKHVGFCGNIKTFPSDFIVTEINTCGQLVSKITTDSIHKSTESLSRQPRSCQEDSKIPRLTLPEPCIDEVYCSVPHDIVHCTSELHPLSAGELEDYKPNHAPECHFDKAVTLDSLLDKNVREQLNQFACHAKKALDSKSETQVLSEFSLGPVLDKKVRASLHGAIRQEYPFLVTITKCGEIFVKANQDFQELCELVSEEEACGFLKFLDAKSENSKFAFNPDGNKEHRKKVHHFLSKKFGKLIEAKSFPDSQQKVVIIVRFRGRSGSRKRANADLGEKQEIYTAFTLQKENLETLEAISYLSSELGVLPSDFSYSGIKDKKAITYQAMVIKKITPERLKELGSTLGKKGLGISNVHSASHPLKLGQLQGNHFDIIVRDLKLKSCDYSANLMERIGEAIENVKKNGFINYYGPQRFGQGQNIQTDKIGLALLNEELVKAVKLFFTPEDADDPVNIAKKYFLQTEDAKGTLAMLPDFKVREKMLLRALNRYGINQEGCTRGWLSIPHSMRIFYVHAYCSKIWNEAASYRIMSYGARVVAGDLIFSGKCTESCSLSDKVHVVTLAEEMADQFTIHQVVLPMVGYTVQYPTNKVGEWYRKRLADDGLQMHQFRLPALHLNVPGCYRPLLKYPHNLSYHFLRDNGKEVGTGEVPRQDSKISLSLSFQLDPSCYATVCLGEIMNCEI